jgi:hypothetical protein
LYTNTNTNAFIANQGAPKGAEQITVNYIQWLHNDSMRLKKK